MPGPAPGLGQTGTVTPLSARPVRSVSLLALGGCLLAACSSGPPAASSQSATTAAPATTATTVSTVSTTTTSTRAASSAGTTPTTNPSQPTSSQAISVTAPAPHQTVASPVQVSGTATVSTVTIQLSDAGGDVLVSATAHPGAGGRFTATLRFATTSTGAGTLTLYDVGAGGARQDITQVPVQLSD